jgi:uncharacterized protein
MATDVDGTRSTVRPLHANRPAERSAWAELRHRVTIPLRPLTSPVPIGLFGLAAATFALSGLQLGWVDAAETRNVAVILMTFAFLSQGWASVLAALAHDGVVTTAMAVLGLTWLLVGSVLFRSPRGSVSDALGLFLIVTAIAMASVAVTAAATQLVPALIFATASVRFALAAVYELDGGTGWEHATGVVGIVLFALALYGAWAAQLDDARGRTILPLGPRDRGVEARPGTLQAVRDVPHKPGVRSQP